MSATVNVGGQAVIEGVMMRAPGAWAIAVRRQDGGVEEFREGLSPPGERWRPLRLPFLRGFAVLWETVYLGVKALTYSAELALEEEESRFSTLELAVTIGAAFLLAIVLFVVVPHFLTKLIGGLKGLGFGQESLVFHVVDGALRVLIFVGYLFLITIPKDMRRVLEYHGAEHKAIGAFEAGEELTVARVMDYPRFHDRCGTSFILVVIMVAVLAHAFLFKYLAALKASSLVLPVVVKVLVIFPIAGLAYEIIKLGHRFHRHPVAKVLAWPGMVLQRLTTLDPDPSQVEVAIRALKLAVNHDVEDRK